MGVDLGDLCVKNSISLDSLEGKIIGVDAYNVLYQFLSSIRQADGTPLMDMKGRTTGHLSGLFYRTVKFVENGIKPVYVFDGKPPVMKESTLEERKQAKQTAMEKWKRALEEKKTKEARKFAMGTSKLTSAMVEESKELLDSLGIPYVQAPGEGEAQASIMAKKGKVDAVASQDYDSLLFGAPVLLRNISITGRRKVAGKERYITIQPEKIVLKEVLESLGIDRKKLIYMALLLGTDFNEGVRGVGPKTAIKILKKYGTLKEIRIYIKEKYDYEFQDDIEDVVSLFMNPPSKNVKGKFRWGDINQEKINEILVERHDFSEDRVEKTIERAKKAFKEKGAQKKLGNWF